MTEKLLTGTLSLNTNKQNLFYSVLFYSILFYSIVQLQLVLECGCEVDCRNGRQETPLMVAIISKQNPKRRQLVVQTLVQNGANVNSQNVKGQTPLMYACLLNQVDTLCALMSCVSVPFFLPAFKCVRKKLMW